MPVEARDGASDERVERQGYICRTLTTGSLHNFSTVADVANWEAAGDDGRALNGSQGVSYAIARAKRRCEINSDNVRP